MKRFLLSLVTVLGLFPPQLHAQTLPAPVLKAKREAEAKGYLFFAGRDEIVRRARDEGKIHALVSLDPDTYPHLARVFKARYPFIDVKVDEITGTEATQRYLLEVQAGKAPGDAAYISEDFYNGYIAHGKKFDLLGMAEQGILDIPAKMIDPLSRKAISASTIFTVVAYNKCRADAAQLPDRWEDFLKPEFKGKKFVVDIRPFHYQSFAAGAGEEWMLNYATKIGEQQPVWFRGASRVLPAIAAGEYMIHSGINYHTTIRAQQKDKTGCLATKIIEPVPVRLSEPQMILETAQHPYSGLLWLEFLASAEAQAIIDKYEPLKSSIHAPQSAVANALKGKKIWLKEWKHYEKGPQWMGMAVKAFGFPKVQK